MKHKLTALMIMVMIISPIYAAFTDPFRDECVKINPSMLPDDAFVHMPLSYNGNPDFTSGGKYSADILVGFGSFAGGADMSITTVKESDGKYTVKPSIAFNAMADWDKELTDNLVLSLGAGISYRLDYTKSGVDSSVLRPTKNSGLKFFRTHFEKERDVFTHMESVMVTYADTLRGALVLRNFTDLSAALSCCFSNDYIEVFAEASLTDVFHFSRLSPGAEARITFLDTLSLSAGYERGYWKAGADLRLLCLRLYGEYRQDGEVMVALSVFC